jgi:hypothetical protein
MLREGGGSAQGKKEKKSNEGKIISKCSKISL